WSSGTSVRQKLRSMVLPTWSRAGSPPTPDRHMREFNSNGERYGQLPYDTLVEGRIALRHQAAGYGAGLLMENSARRGLILSQARGQRHLPRPELEWANGGSSRHHSVPHLRERVSHSAARSGQPSEERREVAAMAHCASRVCILIYQAGVT